MFKVEGSELLERLLLLRTRMGAVRANHPPSTPNSPGHTPSTIPTTPGARERPRPSQTVTTAGVWSKTVDFLKNRTPLTMDGERPRVDSVASAVLETYSRLGTKGKPKRRNNGAKEWTVLAGFCLCYKGEEEQWDVRCIALGTGLKVLPHSKLPVHGDVLHDSHAEIIARRGLVLFLYKQLEEAANGRPSCFERSEVGDWKLRDGIMFALYVSTLPCGDASTYHLSLQSSPSIPSPPLSTITHHSTLLANSLGLHTSRTTPFDPSESVGPLTLRGRTNYSALSNLRTKPGRADSPPSTSHSCSDKIAMWNVLGLASGLLATLLGERAEEVRLGMLVVGGVERGEWDRVGVEVNRAVGGRVGKDEAVEVGFTELPFKDGERDEEGVASCAESISWVLDSGVEVMTDGIKQGTSSRRAPGSSFPKNKRSRLCKLSLFETHLHLQHTLGILESSPPTTYHEAKHPFPLTPYHEKKTQLRAKGGSLEGWIVSGQEFELFDVEGVLQSA